MPLSSKMCATLNSRVLRNRFPSESRYLGLSRPGASVASLLLKPCSPRLRRAMDPPLDLEALNFRSNNSLNEGSEWYFFQSFSAPFLAAFRFFSRSISCVFHAWIISSRKIGSELYLSQNTCAPSLPIREKKLASTGDYFNWRFKPPPRRGRELSDYF